MVNFKSLSATGMLCVASQAFFINGQDADDAIIGGQVAGPNDWKYTVSLQAVSSRGNTHWCGGVLISPTTVLTAAHCVGERNLEALVGTRDWSNGTGKRIKIIRTLSHEDYGDFASSPNDIAILELEERADTVPGTEILSLDTTGIDVSNSNGIITGWGSIGQNTYPDRMRVASVPIHSNTVCKQVFGNSIVDSMICIGERNGSKTACNADSGGPLMKNNILIGLTSFGRTGCTTYAVYTRVFSHLDWIQARMNGEGGPQKEECQCVGFDPSLRRGQTCGSHGENFNWCYTKQQSCPGSKPSRAYPGYRYFECEQNAIGRFNALQLERENTIPEEMTAKDEEDFTRVTSGTNQAGETKTAATTNGLPDFALVGMGAAGGVGLASVGAMIAYKRKQATAEPSYETNMINSAGKV